ncbi:MAG: hypothetical protein WDW38_001288 [Sanguina aurantia]
MAERDLLFAVRNNFYLGAYNTVIQEASDLETLSDAEKIDRDVYVYRSYVALGSYELVISEIRESSAMALQAVKLLAQHLSGKKSKDQVTSTLTEWMTDSACNRNPGVLLMCGIIHAQEGNYVEALKACHTGITLEMSALCVQVYLKMDRLDKAESQLKAMTSSDDDATITQLATAWVGVAVASLYNGRAVCAMKAGQWEDAERDLLDAMNKDAKDPDTLANLVTVGLHLSKNVTRYTTQLKQLAPSHPTSKRLQLGEDLFDRATASMA